MDYIHIRQDGKWDGKYAYEHRIPFGNQTILALLRHSDFFVQGIIVNENYRTTPQGVKVSEINLIEPLQENSTREAVQKHFEPILKRVFEAANQKPREMEVKFL